MYTFLTIVIFISIITLSIILINYKYEGNFKVFFKLFYNSILLPTLIVFGNFIFYLFRASKKVIVQIIHISNVFGHQDAIKEQERKSQLAIIYDSANLVKQLIIKKFLIQSCSRCQEFTMKLISFSPNARSIEYECVNCNKKIFSSAGSPSSMEAVQELRDLTLLVERYNRSYPIQISLDAIVFEAPLFPLPFEKTTREPIPPAIRSEIWRRDNGCCVQCGSNQNLQFDHIIPVSKGGSTTLQNLQLLCQQCNLSKGAKI